jgi:hypothetical protein
MRIGSPESALRSLWWGSPVRRSVILARTDSWDLVLRSRMLQTMAQPCLCDRLSIRGLERRSVGRRSGSRATRGGFGIPLALSTLVQGVSGHRCSTTQRECQQEKAMTGRVVSRIIRPGFAPAATYFVKGVKDCGHAGVQTERDRLSGNSGELALCCDAGYGGSARDGSHCVNFFIWPMTMLGTVGRGEVAARRASGPACRATLPPRPVRRSRPPSGVPCASRSENTKSSCWRAESRA